jgi:hypothetical protein
MISSTTPASKSMLIRNGSCNPTMGKVGHFDRHHVVTIRGYLVDIIVTNSLKARRCKPHVATASRSQLIVDEISS